MDNGQDVHLIMTGGEPLLAWQRLYVELFEHPRMKDLKNVTFETNTTQNLHEDFLNFLNNQDRIQFTWSCSPKLSVSGESWDTAIKPDVAHEYSLVNNSDTYLKFVVATNDDFDEVTKAVNEYQESRCGLPCVPYADGWQIRRVQSQCQRRGRGVYGTRMEIYTKTPHQPLRKCLGNVIHLKIELEKQDYNRRIYG